MITASASSSAGGQQGALSVLFSGKQTAFKLTAAAKPRKRVRYLYSAKSQTYGREIFQRWILYLRYRFHISDINFIFPRHHVCDLVPVSGLQLLTLLLPLEPSVHLPHLSQRRSSVSTGTVSGWSSSSCVSRSPPEP